MKSEKLAFKNKQQLSLAGILDLPESPSAYAVYAHCFTCSKDISAAFHISKYLANNNIAVLRFDFTGLGDSEGNFSDTNFSSSVEDIRSATEFLKLNYQSPKLLVGHSLGGTAALSAAHQLPDIQAITTIASPNKPSHVLKHLEEVQKELLHKPAITIELMGREFTIKKQLLDDLLSYDEKPIAEDINTPLLIMHSPQDKIVSIQEASNIFTSAMHPKSFFSLDSIDHLISNKDDAQYLAKNILSWASRYIE